MQIDTYMPTHHCMNADIISFHTNPAVCKLADCSMDGHFRIDCALRAQRKYIYTYMLVELDRILHPDVGCMYILQHSTASIHPQFYYYFFTSYCYYC